MFTLALFSSASTLPRRREAGRRDQTAKGVRKDGDHRCGGRASRHRGPHRLPVLRACPPGEGEGSTPKRNAKDDAVRISIRSKTGLPGGPRRQDVSPVHVYLFANSTIRMAFFGGKTDRGRWNRSGHKQRSPPTEPPCGGRRQRQRRT